MTRSRQAQNLRMLFCAGWAESPIPGCYRDPLSGKCFVTYMAVRIQKARMREKSTLPSKRPNPSP
jgi:hypothetical protein